MTVRAEPLVIEIIGAGEMGAAAGRRLREAGARVFTSLSGRGAASADRARRAGLEIVEDQRLTESADVILSIVPPAAAIVVAERLRDPLRAAASPPIFADCNAVVRATMRHIEARC